MQSVIRRKVCGEMCSRQEKICNIRFASASSSSRFLLFRQPTVTLPFRVQQRACRRPYLATM